MPKILVVDDLAMDRLLAGDLLADAGHEICYAANGHEALAQIKTEAPQLVVTDLMMPELTGLELVSALQDETAPPPVIIITSQGSEEAAVAALQAGAASYVPKKRLAQELLNTASRVLNAACERRHHRELLLTLERQELHFVLPTNPDLVSPLAGHLHHAVADHWGLSAGSLLQLYIAVEEALTNAIYHGNLQVGSELRASGRDDYYKLARQRCDLTPFRDRKIFVLATLSKSQASFSIRDEGAGFDHKDLPDPTNVENLESPSGRGVLLMRTFMNEVRYNASGNEVTMVKLRAPG
jgi:CheY-like chemotaxis protein